MSQKQSDCTVDELDITRAALRDAGLQIHQVTLQRDHVRAQLAVEHQRLVNLQGVCKAALALSSLTPLQQFTELTDLTPPPRGEVV